MIKTCRLPYRHCRRELAYVNSVIERGCPARLRTIRKRAGMYHSIADLNVDA
jgi:hypothetical protein